MLVELHVFDNIGDWCVRRSETFPICPQRGDTVKMPDFGFHTGYQGLDVIKRVVSPSGVTVYMDCTKRPKLNGELVGGFKDYLINVYGWSLHE